MIKINYNSKNKKNKQYNNYEFVGCSFFFFLSAVVETSGRLQSHD